jgi:hypothetical protein
MFPGDSGYPGTPRRSAVFQFAPRAGVVDAERRRPDERSRLWGVFYDTPHFFNTRFANNPPWGADHHLESMGVSRIRISGIRAATLSGAELRMSVAAVSRLRRLREHAAPPRTDDAATVEPERRRQWALAGVRRVFGNHSSHLWRATELNRPSSTGCDNRQHLSAAP